MWNLKRNDTTELLTKKQKAYRLRAGTYGCQGKGWREGMIRHLGMGMYTLLYLKCLTNKDLFYSTPT